jgi:hypothetical protein
LAAITRRGQLRPASRQELLEETMYCAARSPFIITKMKILDTYLSIYGTNTCLPRMFAKQPAIKAAPPTRLKDGFALPTQMI